MSFAKIAPLRAVLLASSIIVSGAAASPAFAQGAALQTVAQETETDRLNTWFASNFEEELEYFPANKTGLGIIDEDYGRWNDISQAALEAANQRSLARLEEMRTRFDFDALDPVGQMSWRLFEYSAERAAESEPFDRYGYVFNQLFGPHTGYLAFLIGQHRIETADHAEAYIQRLSTLDDVMDMHIAEAEYRFDQGIEAPAWVYDRVHSAGPADRRPLR